MFDDCKTFGIDLAMVDIVKRALHSVLGGAGILGMGDTPQSCCCGHLVIE